MVTAVFVSACTVTFVKVKVTLEVLTNKLVKFASVFVNLTVWLTGNSNVVVLVFQAVKVPGIVVGIIVVIVVVIVVIVVLIVVVTGPNCSIEP